MNANTLHFSEDVRRLNPDLKLDKTYRTKSHNLDQLKKDGLDSALERDFHEELKARGLHVIRFDKRSAGWTFLLPGGVAYTPDFLTYAREVNGHPWNDIVIWECKGEHVKNTRESKAKFKIAAGLYPMFRWVWVTRSKAGVWYEKEFLP